MWKCNGLTISILMKLRSAKMRNAKVVICRFVGIYVWGETGPLRRIDVEGDVAGVFLGLFE